MPLVSQGGNVTTPTPSTTAGQGTQAMTYAQVKNAWIQAGGNPQAADMAAAVADAESGFNPSAQRINPDGSTGIGLWLLPSNGNPPGSTDPVANARAAVQQSNNGTDWTQWCSTWSDNNCGLNGGTYLGSGANALGSLGSQLSPSSYNMFGAKPAGSGVGASTATQSSSITGTTGSSHTGILILLLIGGVIFLVVRSRRSKQ